MGRRFCVLPRATWRARDPKPRHCSVSVRNRWAGDTQSMTRSFASPPEVNKGKPTYDRGTACEIKLTRYSVWWTVPDRFIGKYRGNSIFRTSRETKIGLKTRLLWEFVIKLQSSKVKRETTFRSSYRWVRKVEGPTNCIPLYLQNMTLAPVDRCLQKPSNVLVPTDWKTCTRLAKEPEMLNNCVSGWAASNANRFQIRYGG